MYQPRSLSAQARGVRQDQTHATSAAENKAPAIAAANQATAAEEAAEVAEVSRLAS